MNIVAKDYLNSLLTSKPEVYDIDNIDELKKRLYELKPEDLQARFNILINLKDIEKYPTSLNKLLKMFNDEVIMLNSVIESKKQIQPFANDLFYIMMQPKMDELLQDYDCKVSELKKLISNNNKLIVDIYINMNIKNKIFIIKLYILQYLYKLFVFLRNL
jgi:predicted transcriptional regulator